MDSYNRQQSSLAAPEPASPQSSQDSERLRRRESLALSRKRVSRELECSTNGRYREYLRRSLDALDQEIAKLA